MISVVIPIFVTNKEQIDMTSKCIRLAKQHCDVEDVEWVIVETCSQYFIDEADIYIYEAKRTTPVISINRAFQAASGDRIACLSNDVYVSEKWLSSMNDCFKIKDCGLSTLGTTEFRQTKEDRIIESIYFPVAMIPKKYAHYDSAYKHVFCDTDIVMRVYLDGLKMYQNLNSICDHLSRATLGELPADDERYIADRITFRNKYIDYINTDIYKRIG
jgi:hypothetical protein